MLALENVYSEQQLVETAAAAELELAERPAFQVTTQHPESLVPVQEQSEAEVNTAFEEIISGEKFQATPEEHERLNAAIKMKGGRGNGLYTQGW
jgi:hypothetical protein